MKFNKGFNSGSVSWQLYDHEQDVKDLHTRHFNFIWVHVLNDVLKRFKEKYKK